MGLRLAAGSHLGVDGALTPWTAAR
jgi:hypothetical protein